MKHWENVLAGKRQFEEYELETIAAIRRDFAELSHLSYNDLHKLWVEFSDGNYCASFLIFSDFHFNEFKTWCLRDVE